MSLQSGNHRAGTVGAAARYGCSNRTSGRRRFDFRSGICYQVVNPNCKVYGVQAAGAPSMYNSIRHHQKEILDRVSTIADESP